MKWQTLTLVTCVGTWIIAMPASAPQVSVSALNTLQQQASTQLSGEQLQSLAKSLTVKILSQEVLGSGILLQKQEEVYTIITNAHVLRAGDPPYKIETPDGKIYAAVVVKTAKFEGNDLSLLQFRSKSDYAVAKLGATPQAGDEVFAAGFPFTASPTKDRGFVFRTGKVWRVLDKALEGGYQVGYTNDIEKGMSGGPLLNRRGEVVGINGMHAYPLWGDPYIFKDGSEPEPALREQMSRYSWGIPMETFKHLGFELVNNI
ncbi:MAG TPA: serine protease [Cyanobacteria bacterium UBA11369]|nr:serine protease [Cyanobacteria bacterium UBA11371]HBE35052.1 serine protease [Cyanobacteria bacterium UBA11368]HBE48220.1 serine protease [Cyanobacteria bacterium UBA11369]